MESSYAILSYASADSERVFALRDALGTESVAIWMDRSDILPGTDWQKSIKSAIRGCEVLLVVVTHASIVSREVQAEWSLAISLGKRIIPVIIENDVEIPFRLATLQFVRLDVNRLLGNVAELANLLPKTDGPLSRLVNPPCQQ